MASYLQNQPVQFNPYTPSVNADLYSKVGMYKQGQYEEGVKQSQSFIDSVAGLPIYTDVDKQYLQQKLKGVQSQIDNLAGADFSDHSIVGKIKTYAAAVANDSVIENAVASTTFLKKQIGILNKAKESGEGYSPTNENYFNKYVQEYANSTTPGTSFNTSYKPYVDIQKDLTEFLKGQHPDSYIRQEANGGYTLREINGEEIDPEKIKAETRMFINSNGKYAQQAQIDGWGQYANVDANSLINENMSSTVKEIEEKRKTYTEKLDDSNPKVGAAAKIALQDLATYEKQLKTKFGDLQELAKNPAQFQTHMYIEGVASMMANRFGYSKISDKVVENPEYEAQVKEANNWINYSKYLDDAAYHKKSLEQKDRELDMRQRGTFERQTNSDGTTTEAFGGSGGQFSGNQVPGVAVVEDADVEQTINTQIAGLKANVDEGMMKAVSLSEAGKGLFETFNNGQEISLVYKGNTQAEKDANKAKATQLFGQMMSKYSNGETFTTAINTILDQYQEDNTTLAKITPKMVDVNNKWNSIVASKINSSPKLAHIREYEKLNIPEKEKVFKTIKTLSAFGTSGQAPTVNSLERIKRIISGQYPSMEPYAVETILGQNASGMSKQEIINNITKLQQAISNPFPNNSDLVRLTTLATNSSTSKLISKYIDQGAEAIAPGGRNKFFADHLRSYMTAFGGNAIPIPHDKKQGDNIKQQLLGFLGNLQAAADTRSTSAGDEITNAQKILNRNMEDVGIQYLQPNNQSPALILSTLDETGKALRATILLTPTQAKQFHLYQEDAVAALRKNLNLDPNKLLENGTLTRASTGENFYDGTKLGTVKDIKTNTSKYMLKYNVNQEGNAYYIKLHVKDLEETKAAGRDVIYDVNFSNASFDKLEKVKDAMMSLLSNPQAEAMIKAAIENKSQIQTGAENNTNSLGAQVKASLDNPFYNAHNPLINNLLTPPTK